MFPSNTFTRQFWTGARYRTSFLLPLPFTHMCLTVFRLLRATQVSPGPIDLCQEKVRDRVDTESNCSRPQHSLVPYPTIFRQPQRLT